MTSWATLQTELDRWAALGRTASLWWRDDDAVDDTAALQRLLALRDRCNVPLALAVIPAGATEALARRLAEAPEIDLLQHGYAHTDHARNGRKIEFPAQRRLPDMANELTVGRDRMAALFGGRALPVLVPPWNRIAAEVIEILPRLGFTGLSAFRSHRVRPAPGLTVANTHIDIIDWKGGRGFCGDDAALAACVDHLAARRGGGGDPEAPTGLLTHHLNHDSDCRIFVEKFLRVTRAHPAVRWIGSRDIFGAR